ncbi:hypothetical protein ONZ45_g8761 [Pleurotus djamor]|nr:hypothetical protein ONZ45_g8761 [Pleurotus djamor]
MYGVVESWEQKGKFPPNIKPLLNSVAIQAIKLDEYDDHFFNLMPTLFPYNKFTMTILTDRQDELLEELTALANAGFTKAEEEYEKHLSQWAQRQEQHRVEAELNGRSESTGAGGEDPSRHGTEDEGGGGPGGGGSGGGGSAKDAMDVDRAPPSHSEDTPTAPSTATTTAHPKENPPTKRYRLTDAMKLVIWQLVSISNELCRLENEKNQYENSMATKSDQALRKSLYQKIVAAFPPGWMSSGQISREVSVMKKRLERETAENES